jgi:dipeptide/tripeptide permease
MDQGPHDCRATRHTIYYVALMALVGIVGAVAAGWTWGWVGFGLAIVATWLAFLGGLWLLYLLDRRAERRPTVISGEAAEAALSDAIEDAAKAP